MNEKYNDGSWWGWNGGECPVHPKSAVNAVYLGCGPQAEVRFACDWNWNDDDSPIIAFRVTKPYREPRVIWMNEYESVMFGHDTEENARKEAGESANRIAVRYVESPE